MYQFLESYSWAVLSFLTKAVAVAKEGVKFSVNS